MRWRSTELAHDQPARRRPRRSSSGDDATTKGRPRNLNAKRKPDHDSTPIVAGRFPTRRPRVERPDQQGVGQPAAKPNTSIINVLRLPSATEQSPAFGTSLVPPLRLPPFCLSDFVGHASTDRAADHGLSFLKEVQSRLMDMPVSPPDPDNSPSPMPCPGRSLVRHSDPDPPRVGLYRPRPVRRREDGAVRKTAAVARAVRAAAAQQSGGRA